MKKIFIDHDKKMKLCEKFNITQATLSEVLNFKRENCLRHAEIRRYAVRNLGGIVVI